MNILNKIKKKSVYVPALIIIALLGMYFLRSGKNGETLQSAEVKRGAVLQEVTVSGTVKPTDAVELAFEKSGRVRRIGALVGERVTRGDVLAALENGVEVSAVEDAQAKLASKQAHYEDLKAGATTEEINVKMSGLEKARADLATDYASVQNIVQDAFNKADNAVHRQADTLFGNAYSANPKLSFTSSDQQAVVDAESGRYSIETTLNDFKKLAQGDFVLDTDKETALARAKNYLLSVNDFLIKTNRALNAALSLSDATLATDKDALNTARTNVNTALAQVTDQIQAIATGKITVETAKNELAQTKAGATPQALAGALADTASAEAGVKNAEALLAKTYIISPIDGMVTRQDGKVGEIAAANTTLVAVASAAFKIEAFVPEVDVAKLAVGNVAAITLDAYGSDVSFVARVVQIDPAETVIDGVATYKTTLRFDAPDPRIRSGLTANITVTAATREHVLTVPVRAVFEKSGKKLVRVLRQDGTEEEREVKTGLKGSAGEIEITEGLAEGERVLTLTKGK